MERFVEGDRVQISTTSRYYGGIDLTNPIDTGGEVYDTNDYYVYVRWDNGETNPYDDSDLVPEDTSPETLALREEKKVEEQKRYEELEVNLKTTLDDWYGEERYDIVVDGKIHLVTIHYPEILLTSESGKKHTITDLYVRVRFDSGKMYSSLEGWRGSYSKAEVLSDYAHSHLPRLTRQWYNFCLGSGEIQEVMADISSQGFTEDMLCLFLHTLDNYVKWESISGTPYRRISNVSKRGRELSGIDSHYLDSGFTLFKRYIKSNGTSLSLTFNKVKGRFEYLMDDTYLSTVDTIEDLIKVKRSVDRSTYYTDNSGVTITDVSGWKITFKGKEVYARIYDKDDIEEEVVDCAHPDYYQYIIDKLNSSINDKYIRQASADSYSKVERVISIQFPEVTSV